MALMLTIHLDIGANLTDEMFRGIYHGKTVHAGDLKHVIHRSQAAGVDKILVTAGNVAEVQQATQLCIQFDKSPNLRLETTAGFHPTRCMELEEDFLKKEPTADEGILFTQLRWHWRNNDRVRAIGEFGLDYERLQYCAVDVQKKWFEAQLIAAASEAPDLPLFLHQRGAASDFYHIIRRNRSGFKAGVMHSFTGTIEEAHEAIGLGLYVGINGCSLRTDLGLRVVENIPLESMMVESDAPWCEIRPSSPAYSKFAYNTTQLSKERYSTELDAFNLTNLSNNNQEDFDPSVDESTSQTSHDLPSINCDYSSYEYFEKTIKGRCEPLMTRKVLEVIASVKGLPLTTVAEVIYGNSVRVFKI